jgi:uncharacterized LabA/DUF88 family protein
VGSVNPQEVVGTLRLMVFIDAAHVRENLKDSFSDDVLDYNTFLQSILSQLVVPYFFFDVIRVYYYDATAELDDPKEIIQKLYIQEIRNLPGFDDRLGTLKKTKKGPRQKSVDTLIAVDMLSKAYENHYDIALIISGDEDYLPVVDAVKNTGRRVYGVFSNAMVLLI